MNSRKILFLLIAAMSVITVYLSRHASIDSDSVANHVQKEIVQNDNVSKDSDSTSLEKHNEQNANNRLVNSVKELPKVMSMPIDSSEDALDDQAWLQSDNYVKIPEGMKINEYFEQDSYDPEWSRNTENTFYAIFEDASFIEKFPLHGVYENQCKKTICKISFDKQNFSPEFIGFFTNASNAERFRDISIEPDGLGGMHMYVFRGEH